MTWLPPRAQRLSEGQSSSLAFPFSLFYVAAADDLPVGEMDLELGSSPKPSLIIGIVHLGAPRTDNCDPRAGPLAASRTDQTGLDQREPIAGDVDFDPRLLQRKVVPGHAQRNGPEAGREQSQETGRRHNERVPEPVTEHECGQSAGEQGCKDANSCS